MIAIRYFKTRKQAEVAASILRSGGFLAEVEEDKFEGVPIQEFNVPARFKLMIMNSDVKRAAKYLITRMSPAKKINK